MNITNHINELLLKHNCVIVPDLGAFISAYKPASINPINHKFSPPSQDIVFNSMLTYNDGLLAKHIAEKYNISFSDAIEIININVKKIYNQLINNNKITLDQLGTLIIDKEGNISFKPENSYLNQSVSFGLTEFVAPPVTRLTIKKHIKDKIQKEKAKPAKIRQLNKKFYWTAAASLILMASIIWISFNLNNITLYNIDNSNFINFNHLITINKKNDITHKKIEYKKVTSNKMTYVSDFFNNIPNNNNHPTKLIIPFILNNQNNVSNLNNLNNKAQFYIIVNCFKSKSNADIYINKLINEGFNKASLAGVSNNGLYRVSIDNCNNINEAEQSLNYVRNNYKKDAWLLKL